MPTTDFEDKNLTRKERERLFRRREIIGAAKEVFAVRGYNDATLDEIAERAEFGKGTLYNYFQNKDELFEAVIIDAYEDILNTAVAEVANSDREIREVFLATAGALLRLLIRNAGVFMLLMREFHKPMTQSKLAEHYPRLVTILEAPLRRAIERGEVRECDSEEVASAYISSVFSAFKFRLMKRYACCDDDTRLSPTEFEEEEFTGEIERILNVLDITFFQGILVNKTQST